MSRLAERVEDRILRGLELWRQHRGHIEVDSAGCWLIPSESEVGLHHRVSVEEDSCSCDDHCFTQHRCKHIWAAIFEVALGMARPEVRYAADPSSGAAGAPGRRLR